MKHLCNNIINYRRLIDIGPFSFYAPSAFALLNYTSLISGVLWFGNSKQRLLLISSALWEIKMRNCIWTKMTSKKRRWTAQISKQTKLSWCVCVCVCVCELSEETETHREWGWWLRHPNTDSIWPDRANHRATINFVKRHTGIGMNGGESTVDIKHHAY